MANENFDVEIPDGTHLGFSKDSDGAYRGHLFSDDSNELVGHAELFKPALDDAISTEPASVFVYVQDDRADTAAAEREAQQRAETAKLVADLIVVIGIRVSPYVKAWWVDSAAPAVREARSKLGRGREERKADRPALSAAAEETLASGNELAATQPDPEAATEADRPVISSDEAWDRFNAAIRARQFSDEQLAMLRGARIHDGRNLLDLNSGEATGSPRHIEARPTPMIEVGPALLDEGTLAQVRALLDGTSQGESTVRQKMGRAGYPSAMDGYSVVVRLPAVHQWWTLARNEHGAPTSRDPRRTWADAAITAAGFSVIGPGTLGDG